MKRPTLSLLAAAALVLACPAHASRHTVTECREGADFIRNAALSRNNGQPRNAFLDRLHGDLAMIRGMPRASRWFARDKADELLLIRHVERVYDSPTDPKAHEEAFLGECNGKPETVDDGQSV
ncbi:MAG: hypothetical protein ABIN37_14545 [Burkholderiaceae bacterium]